MMPGGEPVIPSCAVDMVDEVDLCQAHSRTLGGRRRSATQISMPAMYHLILS